VGGTGVGVGVGIKEAVGYPFQGFV